MEAVANFHRLDNPRGPAQGKILEDVEGMDSVLPSLPVLGYKSLRHGNAEIAVRRIGKECRLQEKMVLVAGDVRVVFLYPS